MKMPGALTKTAQQARARRYRLVGEADSQRQRMTTYLATFDPAASCLDRLISAVQLVMNRPAIPLGLLAAIVVLKPRRAVRIALWVWKARSWVKRLKAAVG